MIVIDNLCNANVASLQRVADITGAPFYFHKIDVLDKEAMTRQVFSVYVPIVGVFHFASLKAVGESVGKPIQYHWNNVAGTLALLQVMDKFNVHKLVVSSSATVYGDAGGVDHVPETSSTHNATNPYGKTKYFMEEITRDICMSNPEWQIVVLRYFNPVGAHESVHVQPTIGTMALLMQCHSCHVL